MNMETDDGHEDGSMKTAIVATAGKDCNGGNNRFFNATASRLSACNVWCIAEVLLGACKAQGKPRTYGCLVHGIACDDTHLVV